MKTLYSLTSHSIRVLSEKAGEQTGMSTSTEGINLGRRNALRRGAALLVVATATSATSALASEIDQSKWASIFEANYNNGDKGVAMAQRKGWNEDMKDAYLAWKIEKAQ